MLIQFRCPLCFSILHQFLGWSTQTCCARSYCSLKEITFGLGDVSPGCHECSTRIGWWLLECTYDYDDVIPNNKNSSVTGTLQSLYWTGSTNVGNFQFWKCESTSLTNIIFSVVLLSFSYFFRQDVVHYNQLATLLWWMCSIIYTKIEEKLHFIY